MKDKDFISGTQLQILKREAIDRRYKDILPYAPIEKLHPIEPGMKKIVYGDGSINYFDECRRHRTDGPARIMPDGVERYYLNDKEVTELQHKIITSEVGSKDRKAYLDIDKLIENCYKREVQ